MVHLRSRLAAFIRHRRGDMSQRLFARKTGVAQSTIMRIENEDQNVTLQTLEQLCKAFRVDVGELFPVVDTVRAYPPLARNEARPAMIHENATQAGRSPVQPETPGSETPGSDEA